MQDKTLEFVQIQQRFYAEIDNSMNGICKDIISKLMKSVGVAIIKRQEIHACSQCWHEVKPNDYYCSYCGQKLERERP